MTIGSVAIIGTRGYPSFYGGFETLVRKLAPFLAERGWDVTVYGRPGATVDSADGRDPRVTTVTTRGMESKSLSTLSFGATSAVHAARHKPDVALIMNVANGFWLPMLRRKRIPTVINVDGIEWERGKWGKLARTVFKTGAKLTARHGDILIADSTNIGQYWSDVFGSDSVFIPYGGDIPPTDLPVVDGLRKGSYVLMVARFVPENTISEFLDSIEYLSADHDVVIVGSTGYGGPLEEQVRELCSANNKVRWLGHIADDRKLYSLWQNSGAYFHGHSVGGTNPALVQAMACGAPTVARDTVFNREVLDDAAIFVAPTAHGIADAINALMADPSRRQELSARSQKRARDLYSWDYICAQYEDALKKAIDI